MKKLSVVIIALLLGIVALFSIAGCNKGAHSGYQSKTDGLKSQIMDLLADAKIVDKAEVWMNENYLKNNETRFPLTADGLPEYRCQVIDTDTKFNDAFDSFPQEVNFAQEILVVYLFTDINYAFGCELQAVTKNKDQITIDVLHKLAKKNDEGLRPPTTSYPTQRGLAIVLPKCNNETVNVNLFYEK